VDSLQTEHQAQSDCALLFGIADWDWGRLGGPQIGR